MREGRETVTADQVGRKTALPDIAGIYTVFVFVFVILFGGGEMLQDGDTLWHIRAGEVMWARGEILQQDIFSHTVGGQPWTAHEWLAEIVMAAMHRWCGLAGVVLLYALLAALTFRVLYGIARRFGNEWTAIISTTIAFGLANSHLLARPHLFSWFFGVLTLSLLLQGGKRLYILPLLTAVWANVHGGVVLGLLLQGLFLAGALLEKWPGRRRAAWEEALRDNRASLTVLILSVLLSGLNPFGYTLLIFPFRVASPVFRSGIAEWLSPNLQAIWGFRAYILAILLLLSLGLRRVSWTERLFLLFFVNTALVHQRNISVAGIFLTPFVAASVASILNLLPAEQKKSRGGRELATSPVSGLVILLLLFAATAAAAGTSGSRRSYLEERFFPLPEKFSRAAVDYLDGNRPAGKVFNEYVWGDYLIYTTDIKVFIDGRADMYGEEIFGDYMKIARMDKEAEDLLERHGVDWVLFPTDAVLTRYLKVTGEWEEVYSDDQVSVLVRTSPIGG